MDNYTIYYIILIISQYLRETMKMMMKSNMFRELWAVLLCAHIKWYAQHFLRVLQMIFFLDPCQLTDKRGRFKYVKSTIN